MRRFLFLIILILCVSCTQHEVIAQVGNNQITTEHLTYIIQIEQAYENENPDTVSMVFMLIRYGLQEEIAAMHNISVTPEMLQYEAQRFEQETKTPEILKKIISVFNGHREKYYDHYVKPVLIGQLLEQKFTSDTIMNNQIPGDYTEWFQQQALGVPVIIRDSILKQQLLDRAGENTFWGTLLTDR